MTHLVSTTVVKITTPPDPSSVQHETEAVFKLRCKRDDTRRLLAVKHGVHLQDTDDFVDEDGNEIEANVRQLDIALEARLKREAILKARSENRVLENRDRREKGLAEFLKPQTAEAPPEE